MSVYPKIFSITTSWHFFCNKTVFAKGGHMDKKKEESTLSPKKPIHPVLPTRIQTAEGWKRSQIKKGKSPKSAIKNEIPTTSD